jgi:hypothetical protein
VRTVYSKKKLGIRNNAYIYGKMNAIIKLVTMVVPKIQQYSVEIIEQIINECQPWQMDFKYGYIMDTKQFFFQLSVIDVFDRIIIDII